MADRRLPEFFLTTVYAVGFVIAVCAGFAFGDYMSRSAVDQIERRQQIEDACIAGNDNACLIYSAKHGRNS